MAGTMGTDRWRPIDSGGVAAADPVFISISVQFHWLARPASPDDVLDAIVAAWTARRWVEGRAERLPSEPAVDARGLRMEIVY